jgi:hypothetical protein
VTKAEGLSGTTSFVFTATSYGVVRILGGPGRATVEVESRPGKGMKVTVFFARADAALDTVHHRILHQRLQQHGRNTRRDHRRLDMRCDLQAVFESHALDRQVVVEQLQLLRQGDRALPTRRERRLQQRR